MNAEDVWPTIKTYINNGDLASIKYLYEQLQLDIQQNQREREYKFNIEWIWKQAYLHSIVKQKPYIEEWLLEMYETLDLIDKIGLKPTLNYARYLKQSLRTNWGYKI